MKAKKTIYALFLLLTCQNLVHAGEGNCEDLRKKINAGIEISDAEKRKFIDDISGMVNQNLSCAKNLMGRIYYNGFIVAQDKDKAHAIFYDLSKDGYPPSLYNLAYYFISENKGDPSPNMDLLHGLMIKYSGDPVWGYISANARELGWEYLAAIEKTNVDKKLLSDLKEQHKAITEKNINELAEAVKNRTKEVKGQSDAIMAVIAIGLAVNAISRSGILNQNNLSNRNNLPASFYTDTANPRYYQFMPTANPGLLYGVPIY
jgi:hypothetical protein